MSQPTPDEVRVATDALRTESGTWNNQSDTTKALSAKTATLEFGRLEAGLFQMMVGPYNDVIHAVTARANEGVTAMKEIADTLHQAADTYEQEDRAGAHRIKNVY
ncbi:hypothetical protein ACWT_5648 [Actinoplanes sp. SE50]|uniref:type VII secretion target n=1 Tax=unclassified Actinoplanes TaxID=2626549 RepID=UPI00023ED10C|nr:MULTISPECIES: type VII secretion target [unclassified Actinoplanes]AEV86665.1 hypothetical protein ACPL_5778 [Actinoplanes sp. SE50/110]ATO85063.1 hypothetical protein ACWT_5648 [Actinoplanes sp. SE50]SLM02474.1 hypothetical protein ACSP50_5724 [Actinoplanes sp. SE50/110]